VAGGILGRGGKVNGGVDGEGIWLTAFIYICEIEQ
jgi:hypothetical protein